MHATLEHVDEQIAALEGAQRRLATAANRARTLIDGLAAALHVRGAQLAAHLLPRADEALLDGIAGVLGDPLLSAATLRLTMTQRAAELRAAPQRISPEHLRAVEDGRTSVERAAAVLRAEVLRLERDPLIAAESAPGKGLRGVLASFSKRSLQPEVSKLAAQLEDKRRELSALEDDARQAGADVARFRHAYVKAAEAEAALKALPSEALKTTRAKLATHIAAATPATLRQLCAALPPIEVDQLLLLRAKQRYAAAVASRLVEAPFVEVSELLGDARRWHAGLVDGGVTVPEREWIDGRVGTLTRTTDEGLARAARLNAAIDGFALAAAVPTRDGAEPLWWDVIFGAAEDGAFVTEVRSARAAATPAQVPLPAAVPAPFGDDAVFTMPMTVPDSGGPEEFDTARWMERFYGKALVLDEIDLQRTVREGADTVPEANATTATDVRTSLRSIGPYRLVQKLGAGGMAEVHLAEEKSTAKRRVVKLIQPQLAQDPAYVAMFEREARIGMSLSHEHIVRTHELVEVNGERLLILEYVDGMSAHKLCQRLRAVRESVGVAVGALLASDCASGLAYAHARVITGGGVGVVHRDVSPDNLLCSREGVAKIADFGIARATEDATLTRTGELKGKLPFMAPELFEGEEASAASDVFALGVSLYWFISGDRPFQRPSEGATIHAIMTTAPAPLGARVSDVPPDLDVLVLEMLAKDRAARPSAADVVSRLQPFVAPRSALAARVARATAV